MFKRLIAVFFLFCALLTFKIGASAYYFDEAKYQSEEHHHQEGVIEIRQNLEVGSNSFFEEFFEEEEEGGKISEYLNFQFFHGCKGAIVKSREFLIHRNQRKLFILYKSYKIDCCKF